MFFFFIQIIIIFLFILLSIAWYTLFERKILSYSQWRVGPNKTSLYGILQPVFDGLKLIFKEGEYIYLSSFLKIFFLPVFLFFSMIFLWTIINSFSSFYVYWNDFIFFLVFLGLSIFFIMLMSIFSFSKFASLGSVRAAAQTVSYEIVLCFIILISLCFFKSMDMSKSNFFMFNLNMLVFFLWITMCLMECNRAPFDFAEGESELISGFNIEYSSLGFIFIFLSEYGMMLFFSIFSSLMFWNNFFFFFFVFLMFISIRSAYPRYRFDKSMFLCWKIFLPLSIFFVFFFNFF